MVLFLIKMKSKKVELDDGRKLIVLKTDNGVIIRTGCSHCGHGLLIYNNTWFGICAWEGKTFDLNHDFIDQLVKQKLLVQNETTSMSTQ